MKKAISLSLAVVLLLQLAACGGVSGDGSAQANPEEAEYKPITSAGRYVEKDITPEPLKQLDGSGQAQTIYAWEEESIDLLGFYVQGEEDSCYWYHSEDKGETWEEQALPEDWGSNMTFYLDREGGLYGTGYEGDNGSWMLYYRSPEGESKRFPAPELLAEAELTLTPGGYYVSNTQDYDNSKSTIAATNARTGELLWTYELATPYGSYAVVGDQVYVAGEDRYHDILAIDTGEKVGEYDAKPLNADLGEILYAEEQVYYYLRESDGSLCRGIFGVEQGETILEADEYRYATEAGEFYGRTPFAISPKKVIYLDISNSLEGQGQAARLYRYEFDAEATYGEEALSIWALEDKNTIRQAVMRYQEEHPEVRVDYQVQQVDEESGQTLNDILTNLNTKLLAGDGPDVLILDGTNYQSYMEKGVLADLSDVYQETEFVGQTASALLGEDGTCRVIPARFSVPVLFGDNVELADGLASLTDRVKQESAARPSQMEWTWTDNNEQVTSDGYDWDHRPYLDLSGGAFYELLWDTSAPSLISDQGVDQERLRQWLQTLKEVCDYYELIDQSGQDPQLFLGTGKVGGDSEYDYGNREVLYPESFYYWANGYALTAGGVLDSVEALPSLLKYYQEEVGKPIQKFQITSFPGLTEGAYLPELLLSVSAASHNQENAKEFLRTVLSADVQKYTYGDGLPVVREAMEQQMAYFAPYTEEYGVKIQALQELFEACSVPVVTEQLVYDTVYQAANQYCIGDSTLDKAVEQIQSDLSLKMMEQ